MSAGSKKVVVVEEDRQCESLELCCDLTPISKLAVSLHNSSFSTPCKKLFSTPCKKLSFSPCSSDTPQSSPNVSTPLASSWSPDETTSNHGSIMKEKPFLSSHHHNVTTTYSKCKKEHPHSSYSCSVVSLQPSHNHEVQNTTNTLLDSTPLNKKHKMPLFSKKPLIFSENVSIPGDLDTTSQDSGYYESDLQKEDCFSVPLFSCSPSKINVHFAPAKTGPLCVSPQKPVTTRVNTTTTTTTPCVPAQSAESQRPIEKFASLNISEEDDAKSMDVMAEETFQDELLDLSNLMMAPIQLAETCTPKAASRLCIRRNLSMIDTPSISSCVDEPLAVKPKSNYCIKRALPLSGGCAMESKHNTLDAVCSSPKPKIRRCVSASEHHIAIMKSVDKSLAYEENLTGDFSKVLLLPVLERGKQPDLKSISVDTLADVLKGKYNCKMASFRIIDCRYPYEYEGGHIIGAEMWHLPQFVNDHFKTKEGIPVIGGEEEPRHVMVFHCEFSIERGPKAQRLLRHLDRAANTRHYPALHFPEVYLMEGGYKRFYEKYPELCIPKNYVKMVDPKYVDDLKHFRFKSKSWDMKNQKDIEHCTGLKMPST